MKPLDALLLLSRVAGLFDALGIEEAPVRSPVGAAWLRALRPTTRAMLRSRPTVPRGAFTRLANALRRAEADLVTRARVLCIARAIERGAVGATSKGARS